ncbi:MAG: MFS transporter [Prevotella sp.]|nr:MFS transporter [Prevotella sp.]
MSAIQTNKMSNFRWVICGLLFLATTVNYMDRQVLSLTWKDFIAPEFHWTDNDYGTITGWFSIFYALANLFAGKFVDWMGTKKGYLIAIGVWSTGAVMHAGCGWLAMQIEGYGSIDALRMVQAGSDAAVAIATVSVWLFLSCRMILAVGEAGNFPAAIKVTAEYFPKKDRAFATSIFNSGASIGALAAPASIPLLARALGWEMAFIIIGVLGYVWMALWIWLYDKPAKSSRVNQPELLYIEQDCDTDGMEETEECLKEEEEEKTIGFFKCFTFRQTWSFIMGKFLTDGVWWFFLFWAPAYFSDQYGYTSDSTMAILLIFTLYAIVTVLSIGGGYLPTFFVEKKGMNPYIGRMRAMLIFACFPVLGLLAQPLGVYSPWWPAIIIGLLGAGHQAWSANLYSTIGDMFPKSTIATITGIGAMAGGIGSFLINKGSGALFTYAEGQGSAFSFMGFDGKPAGYMIIFCICSVAYLVGWIIMKMLVPKYKPIVVE